TRVANEPVDPFAGFDVPQRDDSAVPRHKEAPAVAGQRQAPAGLFMWAKGLDHLARSNVPKDQAFVAAGDRLFAVRRHDDARQPTTVADEPGHLKDAHLAER